MVITVLAIKEFRFTQQSRNNYKVTLQLNKFT